MDILIAIVLGLIEGVTEFLPISSTGHLIVFRAVFDFTDVKGLFTVVVQLGAIAAVIWHYRADLLSKTIGLFRGTVEALNFWKIIAIGTVPAGLIGLVIESHMDAITTPAVVATALIIGGIVLWLVDRRHVPPPNRPEQAVEVERIPFKKALFIGLGQCVAIIPGVSRSGATIVTGLATGLNRTTATAFSFYLSIPVLVLASGLKLAKHGGELDKIAGGAPALVAGLLAAFVAASLSVSFLLRYISTHSFKPFAYYRIVAGLVIFGLLAWGVI